MSPLIWIEARRVRAFFCLRDRVRNLPQRLVWAATAPHYREEDHHEQGPSEGYRREGEGKVNEAVGNMTDDPAQKAKGQLQQGAGEARKQYGDVKEDIKKSKP